MATIQVYKHGTDTLMGSGTGTIDTKNSTARIDQWTKKAGLELQKQYKLKSDGKTYSDATCIALGAIPPVASFNDVS